MFTLSASTFQALSHAHVTVLLPELALTADGKAPLIDMLLYPFKTAARPTSHRLSKVNGSVHGLVYSASRSTRPLSTNDAVGGGAGRSETFTTRNKSALYSVSLIFIFNASGMLPL